MKERLQKDLISAMKEHNKKAVDTIKSVKAMIQMEEISKKKELTDEEILSVIVKQVKMRKDAIVEFEKANREDLIKSYQFEIDVLNKYLPKQLSIEEVNAILDEAFNKINPTSQKDMGLIMKEVTGKLKGKTDMGNVSKIIKDRLSNL